jgi:hypothetical protein
MVKKLFSSMLVLGLILSLFITMNSVEAKSVEEKLKKSEIYLGTFVEYKDENGNLVTEPYSSELIEKLEQQNTLDEILDEQITPDEILVEQNPEDVVSPYCIACVGDFTYTTYDIYDLGITETWSWLSNPYFIISIAKGATYKESETISATISASYSGSIPSKAGVNSTFGISSSGTKSFTREITLSGPSGGFTSRDFYYQKGQHTHSVKTVEKLIKKGGTVISSENHYGEVGVPALRNYSVDTY